MKLTAFFLLIATLHVSGRTFSQKVTIHGNQLAFTAVFEEIRQQTGYELVMNRALLETVKPVTLQASNQPLTAVLDQCLLGQGLVYTIVDKFIVIARKPDYLQPPPAQTDISGQVTDSAGRPLNGVAITLKGTRRGTVTAANGSFTFKNIDPATAVLQFSYIGYETQERAVGTATSLVVVLKAAVNNLNNMEVVVNTGYQVLAKERSTGSFAKPDAEVMKMRSTTMNVLQRLDGLVPGLVLNNGTNNEYYPVMMRGLNSINASSQPLYVIDGIPVDNLNQVNPNDVEDITVLKDATAASIWGARAANGVIVVTTQRGKNNQGRLKVDYDAFVSFQGKPQTDVFPVMNSRQYIQAVSDIYNTPGYIRAGATDWASIMAPGATNDGQSSVLPHDFLLYQQATWTPAYYKGKSLSDLAAFDNVQQGKDLWYRNALLSNHTLSINGASGKYRVYASMGYTYNKDPYVHNRNNTWQLNARQDYQFSDRLSTYLITNLSYNETATLRGIAPDNRFVPYASFFDAGGQPQDMSWVYRNDSLRNVYENASNGIPDLGRLNLGYNPVTNLNSGFTKNKNLYSRIFTGVSLKIVKGLRFEGTYGGVFANNQSRAYDDITGYQSQVELAEMTVTSPALKTYLPTTGGKYTSGNVQQRDWTIRNQLVYDNSWLNREHQLTVLAGMERQQKTYSSTGTTVRGYDTELLSYKAVDYNTTSLGLANTIINTNSTVKVNDLYNETYNDTRFISYYGNAAYTFKTKYTLNASARIDKSNLFGRDVAAQDKPVWAIGASWLASSESFLAATSWLNRLLVRLTYGITGNSPVPGSGGSYDILGSGSAFGVGSGKVTPLRIVTPGNSKLSWEQTQNLNAGVDFSVLLNRLSGTVDYYYKHTTNLLGVVPQNAFTGFTSVYGNAGVINNSGIELNLRSQNINARKFSWSTQWVFAYNKGKIKQLNTQTPLVYASSIIQRVRALYFKPEMIGLVQGAQPFSLYAYRYAGLDSKGDPQIRLADGTVSKTPGVAKVEDLVNMGSTQPLITGGLSNSFRYGAFSLFVNMVYNFNFVLRRDVNQFYTGHLTATSFTEGNLFSEFANRWKQAGDEQKTNIPAYDPAVDRTSRTDLTYYTAADINVIKGDFIKLRDITLSWQVPETLLRKAGITALNFRAQLNNVMLWKANDEGIDPEFYNGTGNGSLTYVGGLRTIPFNQHSVTIGLHLTL